MGDPKMNNQGLDNETIYRLHEEAIDLVRNGALAEILPPNYQLLWEVQRNVQTEGKIYATEEGIKRLREIKKDFEERYERWRAQYPKHAQLLDAWNEMVQTKSDVWEQERFHAAQAILQPLYEELQISENHFYNNYVTNDPIGLPGILKSYNLPIYEATLKNLVISSIGTILSLHIQGINTDINRAISEYRENNGLKPEDKLPFEES